MLITHLFHKVINMFVPLFVNKLQSYPQSWSISLHNGEELSTFPLNLAQKEIGAATLALAFCPIVIVKR